MPFVMVMAMAASNAHAQSATPREQDEAVGASINYVFATDLGSGVYDLDGRTLQIYQLTYRKELREATQEKFGIDFELPVTFGFFDFKPVDVLSEGIPTRVDSFSAVPGMSLDFPLRDDWHLKPYVRAGFSVASSHVDGWLYGAGVHLEKNSDFHGWDSLARSEFALAGVEYRDAVPNDRFVRLRQGFDLRRGLGLAHSGPAGRARPVRHLRPGAGSGRRTGGEEARAIHPGRVRLHLRHASALPDLALRCAAPGLRLSARGHALRMAIRDRRAVLNPSQAAGAYFAKGASCAASARWNAGRASQRAW